MSVGGMGGILGGAAGSPLSQSKGAAAEQTANETAAQKGKLSNEKKADAASGVGQTDGEGHEAHDRDGDGRKLWEAPVEAGEAAGEQEESDSAPAERKSKDASGNSGGSLDLSG